MNSDASLLFLPPHPPLRVEPGREVVLGRGADCDLHIPSAQASRRHAVVCWRDGAVVVRDLGSTNGTLVNGAKISGDCALEPGDRIDIAGSSLTFCRVSTDLAEPVASRGDQTVIAWGPAPATGGAALKGNLAKIPIFAVLQVLEMGDQSGCLVVEGADGEASVWLRSGRIVHAEAAKARALEAAFAVAQTESGRFEFTPGSPAPEESMSASVTEVILEAMRRIDEENGRTAS
jgi:pSer/pThr/pTyr-binding forkhead associated (FHA) protein